MLQPTWIDKLFKITTHLLCGRLREGYTSTKSSPCLIITFTQFWYKVTHFSKSWPPSTSIQFTTIKNMGKFLDIPEACMRDFKM